MAPSVYPTPNHPPMPARRSRSRRLSRAPYPLPSHSLLTSTPTTLSPPPTSGSMHLSTSTPSLPSPSSSPPPTPPPKLHRSHTLHQPPRPSSAHLLASRYIITHLLGAGAFSKVYACTDVSNQFTLAAKLEPLHRSSRGPPLLPHEAQIYSHLHRHGDAAVSIHVPRLHWYGTHGMYRAVVLDLKGLSLGQVVRRRSGRGLSARVVLRVGLEIVEALKGVHGCGVVHRDIKPENMVLDVDVGTGRVYLVDFGLAKWRRDGVRRGDKEARVGTVDFASVNSMMGRETGRRDDLMSLGYSMVWLYRGELPWSEIRGGDMERVQDKVLKMKRRVGVRDLCRGLPREVEEFMRIVWGLGGDESPDYGRLAGLLKKAMERKGYEGGGSWGGSLHDSR